MPGILTVTAKAGSRALAEVKAVQQELGIAKEGTDPLLRLIRAASGVIERWCGRSFAREGVREVFRGEVGECVNLARYPVISVSSVAWNGTPLTDGCYEVDAEAGQLWMLRGDRRVCWEGRKTIIEYEAGYVLPPSTERTLPEDVERACIILVTSYYHGQGRDLAVRSEGSDDVGQVSWLDPRTGMEALLPQVAGILRPYRRYA